MIGVGLAIKVQRTTMSLLDDEDEPFVDTPSRSYTREPLYDDRSEGTQGDEGHRAREKKDKKKLDDRKSSAKPWSKTSTEKTPKKSKHNRTKSGSPPPVSPKGRGQEQKRPSKGTGSQIHPSPNVKGQRKRYVQLGVEAGSSSEGEVDLESEGGFLLSNQPALSQHNEGDVMDSLGTTRARPSAGTETVGSPKQTKGLSFFDQETSEAHSDAWWPQTTSKPLASPRRMTYSPGATLGQRDIAEAFLPHAGMSLPASSNPLLGEITGFPPPQQQQQQTSLFGQSTAVAPSQQPASSLAPPTQSWPAPSAQEKPPKEPDWTISNDLRQKCIQQFNDLNPMEGRLQGDKAREFFVQSKLPNQELSAIWRLSDTDKDNALSETEFCIAMKLVLMRRKGFDIPASLPDSLLQQQQQHEQKAVEKQHPPSVKTDHAKTKTEAKTATQAEETEPSHSDLLSALPTKHEDTGDEILVEIGNQDSDTGLLVDVNEGGSPTSSPPPPEPAIAKIISIDASWDTEEDREDTALVGSSTSQPKSDEDPASPSRQKPARPAPPKPSPRRSKTVKERPGLPPRPSERGDGASSSPPPGQASEAQSLLIIDSRQKSKSVRVSSKSPGTSRKDYSILGDSSPSALDSNGQTEEKQGGPKVRWKNNVQDTEHSGDREDKGHSRSTSLDLNKMLLGDNISDVLEDLPSAEPPKPPPKPYSRASTVSDHDDSTTSPTKEEVFVPRARARALSTGSIDTHDDPVSMETSTDALLLSGAKPHVPPKPRRKAPLIPPSKPQRPPLPTKPMGGSSSAGTEQLITKDKAEVQAHIRSLKENNSALTEINGHLEDKLFKLIEQRVRLAKQLKELQLIQKQQQQQVDTQQQ